MNWDITLITPAIRLNIYHCKYRVDQMSVRLKALYREKITEGIFMDKLKYLKLKKRNKKTQRLKKF